MADTERQVVVERDRGSRAGWIVALVVLIVVAIAVVYGLPYITGGAADTTNVNVNPVPTGSMSQ